MNTYSGMKHMIPLTYMIYVFKNKHALPVLDTNKRRGIAENNLTFNRKQGIIIRKSEE